MTSTAEELNFKYYFIWIYVTANLTSTILNNKILDNNDLLVLYCTNHFPKFVNYFFTPFMVPYVEQKFLILMQWMLSIFSFWVCVSNILVIKSFLIVRSQELIFVNPMRNCNFPLLIGNQFSLHHLLNGPSFPPQSAGLVVSVRILTRNRWHTQTI